MDDYLHKLSDELCSSFNLTAVGLGVLKSGSAPLIAVSGRRQENSECTVEENDRWHIGSITKSITSTLIANQISRGEYGFDTPIADLLDHIAIHPSRQRVIVKQLLTHTADLKTNYSLITRIRGKRPSESLYEYRFRLVSNILESPARKRVKPKFQYSNVGYSVAGLVAESVANTDFESLVERDIFRRCNLESAGFGAPQGDTQEAEPMGHSVMLGIRRPANPYGTGFTDNGVELSAAGRAHMNLSDLLKYGEIHLLNDRHRLLEITDENWNILHTPVMQNYACGWVKDSFDWSDGSVLWHNGSNTLWYALLMLLPAKNLVLGFTTNNGAIAKAERAFFGAAKKIVQRM